MLNGKYLPIIRRRYDLDEKKRAKAGEKGEVGHTPASNRSSRLRAPFSR